MSRKELRNKIISDFNNSANGSFFMVYSALNEEARANNGSKDLSKEDVLNRINLLRNKEAKTA